MPALLTEAQIVSQSAHVGRLVSGLKDEDATSPAYGAAIRALHELGAEFIEGAAALSAKRIPRNLPAVPPAPEPRDFVLSVLNRVNSATISEISSAVFYTAMRMGENDEAVSTIMKDSFSVALRQSLEEILRRKMITVRNVNAPWICSSSTIHEVLADAAATTIAISRNGRRSLAAAAGMSACRDAFFKTVLESVVESIRAHDDEHGDSFLDIIVAIGDALRTSSAFEHNFPTAGGLLKLREFRAGRFQGLMASDSALTPFGAAVVAHCCGC